MLITSRGDFAYTKVFYIPPNKQTKEQRETNMKIRNLAFCGVMASILTGWGALAADGDTVIASKAYVDAMDATKQNNNDRVTETWANSTTDHDSTTKYPSMYTLNSAVGAGTSALDGNNADSSDGTSAGTANSANIGKPVVKVTETDGIVTAELGTITDAGLAPNAVTEAKINNGAVTTDKIADSAVTTDKIANSNVTMGKTNFVVHEVVGDQPNEITDVSWLAATNNENNKAEKALYNANTKPEDYVPTVGAVNGLLLRQGTAAKDWTVHSEEWASDTAEKRAQEYLFERAGGVSRSEWDSRTATDNYVPTVAAVEKRVQAAVAQAGANIDKETTNVLSSSNTAYLPTVAAVQEAKDTTDAATVANNATTLTVNNGDDNHFYTADAVEAGFTAVNTLIDGMDLTAVSETGKPIVSVSQADGKVSASVGQIKNAGVASDAAIEYTKMDGALRGINAETAAGMGCSASNPCVLTYLGASGGYRWTAMDTEGVNAASVN